MKKAVGGARAALCVLVFAAGAFSFGCGGEADTPVVMEFVTITPSRGNPTCSDFNPDWEQIKIEMRDLAVGAYTSEDGYLTFEITRIGGGSFDWTSDVGIDAVFVKGGPGGVLYQYDPEGLADADLTAARDGRNYGISHISICYDIEFARISIGDDATNEAGEPHTFTVLLEQRIGFDGLWEPVADGTPVGVALDATDGASVIPMTDLCLTPGTVAGLCEVTFTSPTPGQVTGRAVADPNVGGAVLHVETDGVAPNSGEASKTFVDASIEIGPNDVNGIGEPHVFTLSASYDDGTGSPGAVPDGTVIAVTLTSVGATPTDVVDGCASGTVGGECTVSFVSHTSGTVTGHAAMDLDVAGISLHRETDGVGSNSDDAVKTYVAGSLSWNKVDSTGAPFGGAIFEVCRTHAWESETATMVVLDPVECTTVADDADGVGGPGPDMDPDAGDLLLTDLYLGRYTVREVAAPPGFEPDFSIHTTDLTTTSPVGLLTSAYVNTLDARITIEPDDTNGVGEEHTFTVAAQYDNGMGTDVPVPDGTIVAVTLTEAGGAAVTSVTDGCAIGTVAGSCTVTFVSDTAGTVTGHASITISDGGPVIHVETDGVAPNSGDAVKTYVAGSLSWSKVDGDGAPFGGATFQVCRTHDWDSASATMVALTTPVCTTVVDDVDGVAGPGPDMDPAPGGFYLSDLILGRYTVRETAALPGFEPSSIVHTVNLTTGEPDGLLTTPYVNILDAWITIGADDVNGIGEAHTFTVRAEWDDGTGTDVPVPDGSIVTVTLTPSAGLTPTLLGDTCATGTIAGECTVSFVGDAPGTVTGHAAATLSSTPLVHVETDGVAPNSGDAVKTYVAGSLAWFKVDDLGAPFGGTTFEVCRTHDWNSDTVSMDLLTAPVCVTVVDDEDGVAGPGPDEDPDTGEFVMTGMLLGRYTVRETAAPVGYALDPGIQIVDLTSVTPIGLLTSAFINTPEIPTACSPGFWKTHWVFWDEPTDPVAIAAGFMTTTSFNAVIGLTPAESPYPDSMTMLEAANLGGGGAGKVARHGVAALLNIASGYPYSYSSDAAALTLEIRTAYLTTTYEPLGTDLDTANNAMCPIP